MDASIDDGRTAETEIDLRGRARRELRAADFDRGRESGDPGRLTESRFPDAEAAVAAGILLENLPALWEKAGPCERRRILLTILDAVYVDTVEERHIVAIRPRPAFRPLFELATTRNEGTSARWARRRRGSVFLVETGEGHTIP